MMMTADRRRICSCWLLVILVSGSSYVQGSRDPDFLGGGSDLSSPLNAEAAEESYVEYADEGSNDGPLGPLYDLLIQFKLYKFCKLLRSAQLEDVLSNAGSLTIYAPTDSSFVFLPGGALNEIERNPQLLKDFILYHIIPGNLNFRDIQDELIVASLQGSPLRFNIYGANEVVTVSGAQLLNSDLEFPLGFVNIIDHPLYPIPQYDVVGYLQANHKEFYRLLVSAGLLELLAGGTYTIFAPDDTAFGFLSQDLLNFLATNKSLAERVVLAHVLPGSIYTSGVTNNAGLTSVGGFTLTFSVRRGLTFVRGIPIVQSDIPAINGVVHVINRVLLPDGVKNDCNCKPTSTRTQDTSFQRPNIPISTRPNYPSGTGLPQRPGTPHNTKQFGNVGTVQQTGQQQGQRGSLGTTLQTVQPFRQDISQRPRQPGTSVHTTITLQPFRSGTPQRPGSSNIPTQVGQTRQPQQQGFPQGGTEEVGRPGITQQTGQPQSPHLISQVQRPTGQFGQRPSNEQVGSRPFSPNVPETPSAVQPGQGTFDISDANVAGGLEDVRINHETVDSSRQSPTPGVRQQGQPQSPVSTGNTQRQGGSFGAGQTQRTPSPFRTTNFQRPTSHVTKGQVQRPGNVPWTGQRQGPAYPGLVTAPQGSQRQPQRPGISDIIPSEQTEQPRDNEQQNGQGYPQGPPINQDCDSNAQGQSANCQSNTFSGNTQYPGTGTVRQPVSPFRAKTKPDQRVSLPPPPTRASQPTRFQTTRYPGQSISHTPGEHDNNQLDNLPVAPQPGGAYKPISSPHSSITATAPRPGTQTHTTRGGQPYGQRQLTTSSQLPGQRGNSGSIQTPNYPIVNPTRRGQVTPSYPRHTPLQPQISATEVPKQIFATESPVPGTILDQSVKTQSQPSAQKFQKPQSTHPSQSRPSPAAGRITTVPPHISQPHQRPPFTPSRTSPRSTPSPIPQGPPIQSNPDQGNTRIPISAPGIPSCRQPGDRLTAFNRNSVLCPSRDINQEPCQRLDEPYDSADPRPVCPGDPSPSQCRSHSEPSVPGDRRPLCTGSDEQPLCRQSDQPPDGRPVCSDLGTARECRYSEEPENPSYPLPLCPDSLVLQGCRRSDEPYTVQDRRPDCPPDDCRQPQEPLRPGDRRPLCSINTEDTSQISPQSPHRKQSIPGSTVIHSLTTADKPGKQNQRQPPQHGAPSPSRQQTPSWQRPVHTSNQQSRTTISPHRSQPTSLPRPSWQRPYTSLSSGQTSRTDSPQLVGIGKQTPNVNVSPSGHQQPPTAEDNEALLSPQQRPFFTPPESGTQTLSPPVERPGSSPTTILGGTRPQSSPSHTGRPHTGQRPASIPSRSPSPVTLSPSGEGVGDDSPRSLLQIVQNPGLKIKGHPVSLNVILDLFYKAGLQDILSGPGPSTVFLPSDDAFLRLPKGVIEQLKENPELLRQVLLYHVTTTEVLPGGQQASFSVVTSEGTPLVVSILNGGRLILIGGAKAVAVTRGTNGIFYVINELLYPRPQADIVTALRSRPDLKQITSLILQSGLQDMLTGANPFTLFAPTDAAFAKLPDSNLQTLTENNTAVRELLLGHVTEGAHFGREFLAGGVLPNARGGKLRFHVLSYGYTVNDVNIKTPEIVTGTGVIHLIDSIIIEPQDQQFFQQQSHSALQVVGNTESTDYPEIAQLARGMGLNRFVTWISNTGLAEKVHDGGIYTVLAPTDEAIETLPPNLLQAIDTDPDQVRPLLKYHIISQRLDPNAIRNDQTVSTLLEDKKIRLNSYQNGQIITASGVPVSTAQGSNSVQLILVNQVLYPPSGHLLQSLEASPILQQLATAIRSAHLGWTLTGASPMTLFAPSDVAFDALTPEDRKKLIDDRKAFTDLLKRHIIRGSVFTSGIQDGTQLRNDKGEKVTFSVNSGGVSINSIPVTYADVTATNGVLHVIDHFL